MRLPFPPSSLRVRLRSWLERESARPDLGRALRDVVAVMVPLLGSAAGWLPFHPVFMAFAAQSVAIVDVRGAYTVRLALLLAMTAMLAGAATLGEYAGADVGWSVAAAGLLALLGGCWRHLIPDYGTSLAVASTLLFVVSLGLPSAESALGHHGLGALVGGLWAVLLQVVNWPIRPQHPLRRAVSDSWVAVADLFEALAPGEPATRRSRIDRCEATLRTTLDQAYAVLAARRPGRTTPLRARLEALNLAAARLATRVVALETALEAVLGDPRARWLPEALQPVLAALTNTSRSIAVTLVSRQSAHLATCEVRIDRLANLLEGFEVEAAPRLDDAGSTAQLREILRQMRRHLPETRAALRATVDPSEERAAFPLELFDLHTWTLRPLASALVLDRRVDPDLIRFTARVGVMTMAGVAFFHSAGWPHGYWLPLTMVIVMQPDYGATRRRAVERAVGTLSGSIVASALLWLRLPAPLLFAATAVTIFGFAFHLKRHYARAVFFVTLMVVLLTEAQEVVTLWFTLERLGVTVAGAALAVLASLLFWPVWERSRVPGILAAAIERNRDYARLLVERFAAGGAYDAPAITAKRRAEAANAAVFHSLQRLRADPLSRQAQATQAAALANGNQRVTRALTVLALQLAPGRPVRADGLAEFFAGVDRILAGLAGALNGAAPLESLEREVHALRDTPAHAEPAAHAPGVLAQLPRIATELAAMRLALQHGFAESDAGAHAAPGATPRQPSRHA